MDTSPPPSPAPHPHSSMSSHPPTLTATHNDSSSRESTNNRNSFCDDSAVFIAATQLLELSKRQILNGVIKPHDFYRPDKRGGCSPTTTSSCSDGVTELFNGEREEDGVGKRSPLGETAVGEMSMREKEGDKEGGVVVEGRVNGYSECVGEEGEGEGERQGHTPDCAVERMDVEGGEGVENGEVVTGVDGDSVKGEGGEEGRVEVNSEENRTVTSEEMMEDVFGKFTVIILTMAPSHPPLQFLTHLSWTLAW